MKKIALSAVVLLSLGALANADVFTIYSTRADQNPNDVFDWSQLGPDGTNLATPQVVTSFNSNTALVGNTDGSGFLRKDEGGGWTGNFDYGESLIWTGRTDLGGLGPMAMVFSNPVGSIGFSLQADLYGPFSATVDVFDTSGNALGSFSFSGLSDGSENGSALFIGIGDQSGVNIGRFEISTDSGSPFWANDFAIDAVTTTDTPAAPAVPEPGSLMLLGSGLIGLAGAARRKLGL